MTTFCSTVRLHLCALALAAASMGAAHAAGPTVFGTGVDGSGQPLATGAVDTHFTVTGGGYTAAPTYAVNDAENYLGYWMAPSSTSKWITPLVSNGAGGSVAATQFTYTTQFDLTGWLPASGWLKGSVAADNSISSVLINGQDIGFTSSGYSGYSSFSNFTINNGFVAGLNTLSIVVSNQGGPSGLRAEFLTDFTAAPVPEPTSAGLLLLGLVGVGLVRRRRS